MSDSSPQIEPTSTTASFQPTSSSGQGKKLLSKSEKKSKDQENPILIGLGKSVAYKNGKIVLPKSSTTLLRGKIDIGGAHIISQLARQQGNYANPIKEKKDSIIFRKNGKTI